MTRLVTTPTPTVPMHLHWLCSSVAVATCPLPDPVVTQPEAKPARVERLTAIGMLGSSM